MSEYLVSTICASYCYNDVVCINCGMLRIIHVFVSCSQYRLVKDLVSTIYVCVDNVVVCIDWNVAYHFVFGLFLLANAG